MAQQNAQLRAQQGALTQGYQPPPSSSTPGATAPAPARAVGGGLYPSLDDYMGLELTHYRPVSTIIMCTSTNSVVFETKVLNTCFAIACERHKVNINTGVSITLYVLITDYESFVNIYLRCIMCILVRDL